MAIQTKKYYKCDDYKPLNLDMMYEGNATVLNNLDYDLEAIINTEAPLTYNTLKERLREAFGIAKISGKALEIIQTHLNRFGYEETDNLFDKVIWADRGVYQMDYVRIGYQRQIYDIPKEELKNVLIEYLNEGYRDEELYHKVLNFFGYQVLTAKALEYFDFVMKNI